MDLSLKEIADIVDVTKGQGYTANWFMRAFEPIQRSLEKMESNADNLAISDIFVRDKRKRDQMEKAFDNAYGSLIGSMKKHAQNIGNTNSGMSDNPTPKSRVNRREVLESMGMMELILKRNGYITKIPNVDSGGNLDALNRGNTQSNTKTEYGGNLDALNRGNTQSNTKTEFTQSAINVNLVGIDDKLIERLKTLGLGNATVSVQSDSNESGSFSGKDFLKKILGGVMGLGAGVLGLFALKKGAETNGRLKGSLKLIGVNALKYFANFSKNFNAKVANFLRTFVAGSIDNLIKYLTINVDNLTKGIKELITLQVHKGDVGKKGGRFLLKGLVGIKSIIKKFLKSNISKFLGGLSTGLEGGGKAVGKTAGKSVLKKIPFGIGSLISFYFAYTRFKAGDVVGGVLEIASGIASFFPAVGTAISIGIDLILAGRDLTNTEEEKKEMKLFGFDFKSMWTKAKDWVKEKLSKLPKNIPLIGKLVHTYDAIKAFKNGDKKEGLKKLLSSLAPFGNEWIYNALDTLSFLESGSDIEKLESKERNNDAEINRLKSLIEEGFSGKRGSKTESKVKQELEKALEYRDELEKMRSSLVDNTFNIDPTTKTVSAVKAVDDKKFKREMRKVNQSGTKYIRKQQEISEKQLEATNRTNELAQEAIDKNNEGLDKVVKASLVKGSTRDSNLGGNNVYNITNDSSSGRISATRDMLGDNII